MMALSTMRAYNFLYIAFILLLFTFCDSKPSKGKTNKGLKRGGKCRTKMLAEYNLAFYADWSPKVFTKLYPRHRPSAQWSKLVGRSHDDTYKLWSLGSLASPAVKAFAEDAESTLLDEDAQAYRGIFDSFTAAPITSGMGKSAVRFLADGKRTKVSFMVKMVPSPDWFVGVDSLNLCKKGRWQNEIRVDLAPVDAGTDKGLSFTSPNWPNMPPEAIYQITNTIPDHAAGSFHFPNMEELPRIGHVILTKVAEYKRRGRNNDLSPTEPNVEIFQADDEVIDADVGNLTSGLMAMRRVSPDDRQPGMLSDQIVPPVDCKVSEWSPWSDCSKTCGFGVRLRHRSVIQQPGNGGYGCPKLSDQKTCGSMRSCNWNHFRFLSAKRKE